MYALKVLASVDVSRFRSNQHEFNGAAAFRRVLGVPSGKTDVRASVVELGYDDLDRPIVHTETWMTWYNARENNPRRAPEFRLYYRPEIDEIVGRANPGDLFFLARIPGVDRHGLEVSAAFARQDSTPARFLIWAFSIQPSNEDSAASGPYVVLSLPHGSAIALDAFGLSLGVRFRFDAAEADLESPDLRVAARFDKAFRERELALANGHFESRVRAGGEPVAGFFDARYRARDLIGWGGKELQGLLAQELKLVGLDSKPALDRDEAGLLVQTRSASPSSHIECRPLVDSAVLGHLARDGYPDYLLTLQPGLGSGALKEIYSAGCRLVVPEQLHGAYVEESRNQLLTVAQWIAGSV